MWKSKRLENELNNVLEINEQLRKTNRKLEEENEYSDNLLANIDNIVNSDYKILGIRKTKKNQEEVIVYRADTQDKYSLYLKNGYRKRNNYDYSINVTYNTMDNEFIINSIPDKNISQGYGSVLMDELFNQANKLDVKRISGNLIARVDSHHEKRLIGFYQKKYDFKIDTKNDYIEWVKKEDRTSQ